MLIIIHKDVEHHPNWPSEDRLRTGSRLLSLGSFVAALMATVMLGNGEPSLPLLWRLTIALVFFVGVGRFGFPAFAAFGLGVEAAGSAAIDAKRKAQA